MPEEETKEQGETYNFLGIFKLYWKPFVLGIILVILIIGMFYVGAYQGCKNGGGILLKNSNLNPITKYECHNLNVTKVIQKDNFYVREEDLPLGIIPLS